MAKRRVQRRSEPANRTLINERIRVTPIRLIDENNEQAGVAQTADALRRAQDIGLDLVMVAPNSDPPVCRIMDYGKHLYQQKKKDAKARSHSKQSELKEIRLRPGTDKHDLDIKINKSRAFIADGHKVQFTILFRGRQMAHRDIGFDLFKHIAKGFEDIAHIEVTPRAQGRRMMMLLAPGVKKKVAPPVRPAAKPAAAPKNDSAPATESQPAPAPAPAPETPSPSADEA